jgi:hypothetical protein
MPVTAELPVTTKKPKRQTAVDVSRVATSAVALDAYRIRSDRLVESGIRYGSLRLPLLA